MDSAPKGTSLAATLFRDGASYEGPLELHPLTLAYGHSAYVPRWLVVLLAYGESAGEASRGGRAFREHFDECVAAEHENTYIMRMCELLASHCRVANVELAHSVLRMSTRESPFWELFHSGAYRDDDLSRRLAARTRIVYPPGRYRRAQTASQEYLARCAQALCVYDAARHGAWPELEPEELRRRIVQLGVHLACKRLVALQRRKYALLDYLTIARTEIPFLLNACVLGLVALDRKTTWLARRRCYLRKWDRTFCGMTTLYYGGSILEHVDADDVDPDAQDTGEVLAWLGLTGVRSPKHLSPTARSHYG